MRVQGNLRVVVRSVDHPVAAVLVASAESELCMRYQVPSIGTLDPADFEAPSRGVFVVAELDGQAVGCGGLRQLSADTAELKRLFVHHSGRRQGVAREILRYLERAAVEAGYQKLCLETGTEQPEAIALYESAGYHQIDRFGEHGHDRRSRYFGLQLQLAYGDREPSSVR